MFFEIERIFRDKINADHPARGLLPENVEGLMTHDNGNILNTIITYLEQSGYHVSCRLEQSHPPGRTGGTDFVYSYEKIWEEMTDMDRFLAKLPADKEEYW